MYNLGIPRPDFDTLDRRARTLKLLLIAAIVVTAVALLSTALEIKLLMDARSGVPVYEEEVTANDNREFGVAILYTLIFVSMYIAMALWTYRAYGNLHYLTGDPPPRTPKMVLWTFFIPIYNVFNVHKRFKELVEFSTPAELGPFVLKNRSYLDLMSWFTLLILSSSLDRVSYRLLGKDPTISQMINSDYVSLAAGASAVLACVFGIRGVQQVTRLQLTPRPVPAQKPAAPPPPTPAT